MEREIFEGTKKIVRLQLGVRKVQDRDRLVEDLRAESVDIVNIVAAVESKFGVTFKEEDISAIGTVKDICGYIIAYQSG